MHYAFNVAFTLTTMLSYQPDLVEQDFCFDNDPVPMQSVALTPPAKIVPNSQQATT